MWAAYKKVLKLHPLRTKALTTASLMSGSDALTQFGERRLAGEMREEYGETVNTQNMCAKYVSCKSPIEVASRRRHREHDWNRTLAIAATGLVFSAPLSHAWFLALDKMVMIKGKYAAVAAKMVFDALVYSPVAIAGYFSVNGAFNGKKVEQIQWKLENKWKPALQASWCFWPVSNVVCYGVIPLPFRVLYNNVMAFGWNGYMSHLNASELTAIVADRQQNPQKFQRVEKGLPSQAELEAAGQVCKCAHCRIATQ